MPRVAFYDCYAGCHLGECRYADCRGASLTNLSDLSNQGTVLQNLVQCMSVPTTCSNIQSLV
jgi:hypothetical protein